MARIQDIAKEAGVGVGTVSRFINGNGYVSEDKKKAIQEAMELLGYEKKLRKTGTGTKMIGIIVPTIAHPFFSRMLFYLENELALRGYKCMLINEQGRENKQLEVLRLLDEKVIEGLLDFGDMPFEFKERKNRAIVVFDRDWSGGVPVVRSDPAMSAKFAAEYFQKRGRKRIIQFIGGNDINRSANHRCKELMNLIEKQGGEVINILTEWDSISYEYNYSLAERYSDMMNWADGLFSTDIGALCCQNMLQKQGVRIPDDFDIVAYDGTFLLNLVNPSPPVVQQDMGTIATTMVELLEEMIRGETPEKLLYEIPVLWKGWN